MSTLSEKDLLERLAARHQPPAWAFLRHVADGTGVNKLRTADAMAMSLWPSRGLELHGFEVKSYRSDWLRELKAPAKADELASRCHRWWIVAPGTDVVRLEEVPRTWGLLVADGQGLKVAIDAPGREPLPLEYGFLAALLRRAAEAFCASGALAHRRAAGARSERPAADAAQLGKWVTRLERLRASTSRLDMEIRNREYELRAELHRAIQEERGAEESEEDVA
jgi:hypothetical protein